jgi:hypothetical protein
MFKRHSDINCVHAANMFMIEATARTDKDLVKRPSFG